MTSPAMQDLASGFMACLPADVAAELRLGSKWLAIVQELPSYSQQYGRAPKNWVARVAAWRRLGETLCEAPYLHHADLHGLVYVLGMSLVFRGKSDSWAVEAGVPHYWSELVLDSNDDD